MFLLLLFYRTNIIPTEKRKIDEVGFLAMMSVKSPARNKTTADELLSIIEASDVDRNGLISLARLQEMTSEYAARLPADEFEFLLEEVSVGNGMGDYALFVEKIFRACN